MKKIWMVWRDGGQAPHKQHGTLESAEEEARRLATAHCAERATFVILEAVEHFRAEEPVITQALCALDEPEPAAGLN
jgi:hypothetical protein